MLKQTNNNVSENNAKKPLKSDSVNKKLNELPKVPSHYCRSSSSRIYVDDALQSYSKIHKEYLKWCEEKDLPSVQIKKKFGEILEEQKISIFKPRKDQCDTCVAHKEGNLSEEDYQVHISKKNEAREAKKKAISDVQLCPKLLVSAQYYKQKLQIHIFTIYINNNKDVVVYIWHEGDGGVTACEFITCIMDFVQKQKEEKGYKNFTIISDGCADQKKK